MALPEESSDTLAAFPGVVLSDRFLALYSPPQPEIRYQIEPDGQLSLLDFQVESVVEKAPDPSDRFLALYSPPQPEIRYQIEPNGQLSLDFQVESVVEEAPDPDDFEDIDVFREAIALWDSQHPDISLDSFTYWAPCPDDWYEPTGENSPGVELVQALPESSDTLAASPGVEFDRVQVLLKSSITSEFFILVFGGVSPNEPPTAGVGVRLRLRLPPSFPPFHTKHIPSAYQTHSCFVGGIAARSGRSPPGGGAMA